MPTAVVRADQVACLVPRPTRERSEAASGRAELKPLVRSPPESLGSPQHATIIHIAFPLLH